MENKNCVFCKIVKGEISSDKIYEDESFLVFLDHNPQSPGHAQVVPKKHCRWVWDVPNPGRYFEVAQKIAKAMRKAFETDFILARIAGDEVPHAHIWVFPNSKIEGDKKDFKTNAEKIKNAL